MIYADESRVAIGTMALEEPITYAGAACIPGGDPFASNRGPAMRISQRATSPLCGLRVLVAEDEVLISGLVREVLLSLECKAVLRARNVDQALQAIRSNDIDGALLDVHLGDEDIYPAVNELALRRIPFILMTGQRCLDGLPALLADAPLLAKPFKVQQLEDLMSSSFRPRHRAEPHQP